MHNSTHFASPGGRLGSFSVLPFSATGYLYIICYLYIREKSLLLDLAAWGRGNFSSNGFKYQSRSDPSVFLLRMLLRFLSSMRSKKFEKALGTRLLQYPIEFRLFISNQLKIWICQLICIAC